MSKPFWKSKTVWGFGASLIIAFLQSQGVLDASTLVEGVQRAAEILGVIGARAALK